MVSNVTGAPVCGADLFGREYEMTDLWRRLERGEHILMVAPRRVGKSSLMQELKRAPRQGWTVFYSDLEKGAANHRGGA